MEIKIEEFKKSLVDAINSSGLPLSLASYLIQDILNEIESIRKKDLEMEKAALAQSESIDLDDSMEMDITE